MYPLPFKGEGRVRVGVSGALAPDDDMFSL